MVKLVIFIMVMVVVKNYLSDSNRRKADENSRYPEEKRTVYQGSGRDGKRLSYPSRTQENKGRKNFEQTMAEIIEKAKQQEEENENRRRKREEQERKEQARKDHERKRLEIQKQKEERIKEAARKRAEEQRWAEDRGRIEERKRKERGKNKKKAAQNDKSFRQQTKEEARSFEKYESRGAGEWIADRSNETEYEVFRFQNQESPEKNKKEQPGERGNEQQEQIQAFQLEHYLDPLTAPFYPGNQKEEQTETFKVDDYLFPTLSSFYPDIDTCIREISLQNSDVVL